MNHTLSLECIDTLNRGVLKIMDMSHYASDVDIINARLEILLPGFSIPVVKTVDPNFNLVLNACDLEIQTEDCDTKSYDIPDGIYVLRYSVSPNDVVYVEYNYLKVSALMKQYKTALCGLDLDSFEPDKDKKEKMKILSEVKMYIEAAKAKAEICHEPQKAMELYNYAKKLLSKFNCISCY